MADQLILGIDPGKNGGLAWVSRNSAHIFKMPETLGDIWEALREVPVQIAYLEKVHAMPKQGVSSTFTFGRGFGQLEAFLVAAGIPFEYVAPGTWQRAMGCLTKGDKNVTKQRAQELFPMVSKITHATADALLIAEYGRRRHE